MAIGERIRFFVICEDDAKVFSNCSRLSRKDCWYSYGSVWKRFKNAKGRFNKQARRGFGISPQALSVPDVDSYIGLMHTLVTLEDRYGLTIEKTENGASIYADPKKGTDAAELSEMLNALAEQAEKYHNGDISREGYDKWRYNYPKCDENSGYVKALSQKSGDVMTEAFRNHLKEI